MTRHVTIRQVGKRRGIRFELTDSDEVGGGVGGWNAEQAGRRKRPVLRYAGRPGWTLSLPLIIDNLEADRSIELRCRQLLAWGRPAPRSALPPRLRVEGPIRAPQVVDWVIDSIDWGEQIRNDRGHRVQQELTLKLIEYNRPPKKKKPKK